MNKKMSLVLIIGIIVVLFLAAIIILNMLKNAKESSNYTPTNYISTSGNDIATTVPANEINSTVIEDNLAKELDAESDGYETVKTCFQNYLMHIELDNQDAIYGINPKGNTFIKSTSKEFNIDRVIQAGYSYNRQYYIEASIDGAKYYYVVFDDSSNLVFRILESNEQEFYNATMSRYKAEYNYMQGIKKNEYNQFYLSE